ncbi:hypothetical protein M073_1653 [Bacteroides fragilis str. DS-71]|nr:hypothetical protein M073_1653 [Bacteroides fragilis str. DS-71]
MNPMRNSVGGHSGRSSFTHSQEVAPNAIAANNKFLIV